MRLFISCLIISAHSVIFAQTYFTAMGLRMGSDFGITLQQKVLKRLTAQGILSTSAARSETTATVLVQSHQPLISKRFNFYIGAGLHKKWEEKVEFESQNLHGLSAIAGAEMTLGRLNLSWDYKPMYHLNAESNPFEGETAISLRYVFVKKIKKPSHKRGFLKGDEKKKRKRERERRKRKKQREKLKQKK